MLSTPNENSIPTLSTSRLTLRALSLADAKRVQLLAGVHAVASVTTNVPHPYLDGMAESWIQGHAEAFRKNEGLTFGIFTSKENILIGVISLMGLSSPSKKSEIGYWIGTEYWGQGFCTEAARAVVEYAFQKLKLNK
ncbi:MAG: N-acetyltransferase, partial [Proteobacteria bacterium]